VGCRVPYEVSKYNWFLVIDNNTPSVVPWLKKNYRD
jgi:hypothetical protein